MERKTVLEIMTPSPAWCTPHDDIGTVARLMADHNCGAIPVVDDGHSRRPVGIITDRDIACRVVAKGWVGHDRRADEIMTRNVVTLHPGATIEACLGVMESRQIRRVPIVDDRGKLIGIVSQADIAKASRGETELEHELAEMLEEVSLPPLK